ncbi:MAG TPA: tRNA lysidine(34) synthetase TilS [Verrucomicrobiae bacterium]|nr:tRNA lysidine(34) synthetase TilS [Verrucomicrobiae bacterium]
MNSLTERVEKTIVARKLFRRGEKILIAVSGGVDSMALLRLLFGFAEKYKWQLVVAHLDHQLRGRGSDADERLVVRVAEKFHLPVAVERADVKAFAKTNKLSIEMAARELRHDFLARTAAKMKIKTIALAHHADDQLELFFLRLLRGSGAEGLAGMKFSRSAPGHPKIKLVRPLLAESKSALAEYAAENKIPFREDASNASLDFQRNRIRHELIPLLRRSYQPALDRVIGRAMDLVSAESDFVNSEAARWLAKRTPFENLHIAVQRRCIQLQLIRHGIEPDYELIETLRISPEKPVPVSPQTAVWRDKSGESRRKNFVKTAGASDHQKRFNLAGTTGKFEFGGATIQWRKSTSRAFSIPRPRVGSEVFDADCVGSIIVLRFWQAGDRFQPIGMSAPVKLQDLFTNRKIPREERRSLIVATTADGEIFWVEKLRIGERFKISPETIRRLQWTWKRP